MRAWTRSVPSGRPRAGRLEAARDVELAEAREEAAPLLGEANLIEKFGEEIKGVVAGDDSVRAAKLLHLVLASSQLDEKRVGSELMKGQSAVGKTFLAESRARGSSRRHRSSRPTA